MRNFEMISVESAIPSVLLKSGSHQLPENPGIQNIFYQQNIREEK